MSEQLLLTIVEASLRALLLAALVGALLLLLRVPRGAQRHSAWLVVVVAMLTMPLLQRLAGVLPGLPAPRVLDVVTFLPRSPPSEPLSRLAEPRPRADAPPAVTRRIEAAPPLTTDVTSVPDIPWLQFAAATYGLVAS